MTATTAAPALLSTPSPVAPAAPGGVPVTIAFEGDPWSLAGLGVFNFFLSIITLGIYGFWGRTEVRRRIWSSVRLNGEPLEYTGRGKELFLGFIIVFGCFLLPLSLLVFAVQILAGPEFAPLVLLPFYIIFPFLFGLAVYRTRRYRLSRTRWRGIRGALVGSPASYAWGHYWTMLASFFAGGWLTPWRANYLYRRITNDTRFGDRAFVYKGQAGPLYPPFALAWLGGIVVLMLYTGMIFGYIGMNPERFTAPAETGQPFQLTWLENLGLFASVILLIFIYALFAGWYNARMLNQFTNNTKYQGLSFKLNVKIWGLVWLFVSNQLISILSLGMLTPVAEARSAKYVIDHMSTEGLLDVDGIAQSQAALDKSGEGLAEAFDVDAFG
jgi:uncharacterized membrane protein YjgN (DUF898 family)